MSTPSHGLTGQQGDVTGQAGYTEQVGYAEETTYTEQTGQRSDERSLGEIVSDVATDLSTLIKQEMDLAKTEMKQEAAKAGKGAGLLGGAGLAGFFTLFFLSMTIMWGIAELFDADHPWIGAIIVTVLWGIAAAVLALSGKKELKRANPQLPKTQQTLKEDAAWARAQKS